MSFFNIFKKLTLARIYPGNFQLLSKNEFRAVLATFCCYDHGAKASEEVQKIAIDQKEYRKYSLCVIIC